MSGQDVCLARPSHGGTLRSRRRRRGICRYVGAAEVEGDGEPFAEKMARLTAELSAQFAESARLEQTIRRQLTALGVWEE